MTIVLAVVSSLLASFALTGLARRYAERRRLVDVPNNRSSHALPTPRGGGVGFVIAYLVAVGLLHARGVVPFNTWLALSGAGAAVAAIGFVDDHAPTPARVRFLVHVLAAVWVLAWIGVNPEAAVGSGEWPAWLGALAAVLFIVWLLNLYNFMDGTDGLAGIEAVTVGLGAAWLTAVALPGNSLWLLPLVLAAAVGGFLVWNLPPARIFMGDVGSGFLGVCLATLALASLTRAPALFWVWVILLGVFVVDATFTLLRRMVRGRAFYEAHRTHAYQHAARRFGHRAVMLAVAAVNVLWLAPIAWLVATNRLPGGYGLALSYLPLIGLAMYFRAGSEG
jgi:Fuc2NAc and GlcNAc transferase